MKPSCKVIAIAAQKGGVGKTTSTLNIGVSLSLDSNRVLLIDLDGQCSLTQHLNKTYEPTILQAVKTNKFPICNTDEGVDLVPADTNTPVNVELAKVGRFKALIDDVRPQYDYILIDTSPSVSWLHMEAMRASDYIIIPSLVSGYGMEGVKAMYQYLDTVAKVTQHKPEVLGVLLSMCNNNKTIHKFYRQQFTQEFSASMFNTLIPQCVQVEESFHMRMSVVRYSSRCKATLAYKELTAELLKRINK